jgi:hypothetical protein
MEELEQFGFGGKMEELGYYLIILFFHHGHAAWR